MRVAKLIKEDWPIMLQQLKTTFKSFITEVLEYKAEELKLYVLLCVL